MRYEDLEPTIRAAIDAIPGERILDIAHTTQARLKAEGEELTYAKNDQGTEWVTQADLDIQEVILSYFAATELAGTYSLEVEEDTPAAQDSSAAPVWQLIIDPIDGTHAFMRGEPSWGTFVGAADATGTLRASWAQISTGEIYTDLVQPRVTGPDSLASSLADAGAAVVDYYTYDDRPESTLTVALSKAGFGDSEQIDVVASPASIWLGWQLLNGESHAMCWVASTVSTYPAWDLVFLGPLVAAGFEVRLGKDGVKNTIVCAAHSKSDADALYGVAMSLLPTSVAERTTQSENPLLVCPPI